MGRKASRRTTGQDLAGLAAAIAGAMREGIVILDREGAVVAVNQGFCRITGFKSADLAGTGPPWPFWPGSDAAGAAVLAQRLKMNRDAGGEYQLTRKDGTHVTVLISSGTIYGGTDLEHRFLVVTDISARKETEIELRRARDYLQLVMDTIPQRVFWKDRGFRYLGCNAVFAQDAGVASPEDLVGKNDFDLSWEESAPLYRADDREVMEDDVSKINYEEPQVRKDGTRLWLRTTKKPIKDEHGRIVGVFGSYEDVTDGKLAEQAVRKSEEKYRSLIEQASDGIFLTDGEGVIGEVNSAGCRLLGRARESLIGTNMRGFIASEDLAAKPLRTDELKAGETVTHERVLQLGDGIEVDVEISARMLADGNLLGFVRDVTERKRAAERQRALEQQLRQSQKMEALGTLAGGIAHDFNNILLAIGGYAELVRDDLPECDQKRTDMEQLLVAADRGRRLVERILSFSRPAEPGVRPIDIAAEINGMRPLLRATMPPSVEVRVSVAPESAVVAGNETQFNQLVLNLAANAAYAMRGTGGTLDVSLTEVTLASRPDLPNLHGTIEAGPCYRLSVADTGAGMSDEVLERMFDPFFTTKEVGEGTGLGLSVVLGIVTAFGGGITVQSAPGRGSRFHLYFPPSALPAEDASAEDETADVTGAEHLLVLDDEPQITAVAERALTRFGYRVRAFTDAAAALEAFEGGADAFDLVLTDYTMPGSSGVEVTRRILARRADIPVVLMTGHSDGLTQDQARAVGVRAVVRKPFRARDLARAIRDALDEQD
ncbi:MAG: PAS domain S-box protein [Candidatus Krumholzibacteria bacterium]|nr:PAS domain S-box protein [Candidatus Krumholzibacteria bacterium]